MRRPRRRRQATGWSTSGDETCGILRRRWRSPLQRGTLRNVSVIAAINRERPEPDLDCARAGTPRKGLAVRVGIPREVKDNEYRVAITPAGAHELVVAGHTVYLEKEAGV